MTKWQLTRSIKSVARLFYSVVVFIVIAVIFISKL